MAPDEGLRNSPTWGKSRHVILKKGPWTTSEDMLLLEYVKKHGEGNWNAVQRNSGLMRCGKSCRLRWANHLRPNLKKGAFTPDEEKLIVELHSKLGNKWARMAAQLPGRTDNEIKNYWNTRLKRRLRAGLPIYPHQEHQHELNSSSQTPQLSSLLAPTRPRNPNPFTFNPPLTITSQQRQLNTPYTNHQLSFYRAENRSQTLSFDASNSLFSSSFFNHGLVNHLPTTSQFQYSSQNYGINSCPEIGVLALPSIQSPVGSSSEFVMATASSDGAEDYEVEMGFRKGNKSGLLEDLIGESKALAHNPGNPEEALMAEGGSVDEEAPDFGYGDAIANSSDNYEGAGSESRVSGEGMAGMDDDLMNLLDNFPLSVPIPDWDGGEGTESNGTNRMIESQRGASEYNPIVSSTEVANQDWNNGFYLWNNMLSIY